MATPDEMASDLNQVLSAQPAKKQEEKMSILLASKLYLDRVILQDNQTPRLMESIKDETGALLIRKYEKLSKPIWQKYRSKSQCRPLHFISETPLFVINDVNTTFLIPEDFQFLGALFSQWGNDSVADQFFTEALKAGSADAYINTGVYRYRRGERGVIDNFYVAKKHFNKALNILHEMPLTVDEKRARRKLCTEALEEIDYRFASIFDKFIRWIIRMLTFHFETIIPFTGPAAPKEHPAEKLKQMTESILKREFDLKKSAAQKFLTDLHEKIPVAQSHLESELSEIEREYGGFPSPDTMDVAVARIGEFYSQNLHLLERGAEGFEAGVGDSAGSATERSLEEMCFDLADVAEVEKAAEKYKLAAVGELLDIVANPDADKATLAWIIRDRTDQREVLERMAKNPALPDEVKRAIRQRYGLPDG